MALEMMGRDIWVKTTPKDGKPMTNYHRVWDIGRFMEAQEKEAAKSGAKVEQTLRPPHRNTK